MTDIFRKRVIDLNPAQVRDETLAALEDEIRRQAEDIEDDTNMVTIDTLVIDTRTDGGLDSHATVFTAPESSGGETR
jgi:hypothetical protein